MEHRVTVKAVKSRNQWEAECGAEGCRFWSGRAGLTSESKDLVQAAADFHEEQMAKKEAARAKRRVQR